VNNLGASNAKGLDDVARAGDRAAQGLGKTSQAARSAVSSQQALAAAVAQFTSAERSYIQSLVDEAKQLSMNRGERAAYIAQSRGMSSAAQEVAAAVGKKIDAYRQEQAALAKTEGALSGLTAAGRLAAGALAAIGIGASVSELTRMADASTNVASRLRLVTDSAAELISVQGSLFRVAQDSRVSFTELVGTYAQMSRSTKELGVSQRDMLEVTKVISQAVTISGGSAASAQAALTQLSQGFAAGALRGEELNSVLEQTPRLAMAIANGLGVGVGKLRELGQAGELTAEKVLGALQKSAGAVQREFDQMTVTVEQAVTRAENSAGRLVGVLDKVTGASSGAAGGISRIASGMDILSTNIERLSATKGLSDFFFVAFNSERTLNAELKISQERLTGLEAQLARSPSNIYTSSAVAEMRAYVASIKEAQERLKNLAGGGVADPRDQSGYTSRGQSYANEERRLAGVQAAMGKVLGGLAGIKDSFYKDLNALYAGYQGGLIKLADYQKAVAELIKKDATAKPDAGAAAALSDEMKARIQGFKNADREILDGRKDFYAQLDLMSKTGRVGEMDAIRQSLAEEERVWTARKANFEAELAAASQKKNSQAEVARITGQMQEAERDYAQKQVELTNKITVAEYKRAEAIKDVNLARMQQDQADYAAADRERGEALNRALTLANDYGKAIDDNNRAVEFELGLMGQGERSRKIAIEQYRAQLRLNEQIAKIKKETNNAEDQAVAIAKAQEAYQRELSGIEQKVVLEEWNRTTEEINRTLTDALMRGFENGKGFAENMRDTIVNMFKTMVLRPVISAVLSPVSAAIGGMVNGVLGGGVGGALNGLSGGLNALSTANNAYTALSGYSGGVNTLAGLLGGGQSVGSSAAALGYANTVGAAGGDALGAFFAGNASWGGVGAGSLASMGSLINGGSTVTTSLTGFYTGNLGYGVGAASNLGALGSGTYGMAPVLTSSVAPGAVTGVATGAAVETGAVAAGAAAEGGMMSALASNPYGWIALAVIAAIALFSGKGEKRFGGQYEMGFDGEGKAGDISLRAGPSGGEVGGDYARQLITGTTDGINTLLKDLGSDMALTGFQAGLETSGKGRGGVYAGGTLTGGITFGESGEGNNYEGTMFERTSTQSPNAEEAVKNFATDMLQATVQALQAATDLPKVIAQQLKGVDAEELTDEAATTLLTSIRAQIEFVKGFRDAINELPFANLRDLSFDTATGLITAAGGLEALNQNLTGYFANYFSAEEQRDAAVKRLAAAFDDLDLVMPALSDEAGVSRDAFRALAEGIDVSTEAGQKQYAGLLALQGAFAELTPAVESAAAAIKRSAADIASERDNLQRQIWSIVGDTGAIRAADLARLDESNRPLQEQIWALQDAKAAAEKAAQAQAAAAQAAASFAQAQEQAAQRVRDAWSSVGDSLIDEIKRIRGEVTDTGALGYAHLQSQFALTTAQARAGDKSAAEALPQLSQTLLEMAKDNASSAIALKQMQLQIAASLEETLRNAAQRGGFAVPAFASGGAHAGGWAMVGENGPELAYMPPARIYTAAQTAGMLDQGAVLDELRQLRADNRAQAGEIARLHLRVAKVLEKWDGDGMPAEREEAAA
jgi:tape measure domain-containing protein